MAVLDAEVPIQHRVFVQNTTGARHGQKSEGTHAPAVTRYAYQVYPMHWRNPHTDPIQVEDVARTVTDLLIDVPDPSVYKKRDMVLINGIAFDVQGLPDEAEWGGGTMLFKEYDDMFGGTVHVRRVT